MSPRSLLVASLGLSLVAAAVFAQPAAQPTTQPAADPLGAVHVGEYPAIRFVYLEEETTFADLGQSIGGLIPLVDAAREKNLIPSAGPIMFAYVGVTDMAKPFKLQIGCQVADGTKAPEGFEARDMPAGKYASVLYTGPYTNIPPMWGRFMDQVMKLGLEPDGESRELYLYAEGMASENNVTMFQAKVK